jgi:deazaflavin-dependent oxidoreductase (nitroreductase family)
MAKDAGAIGIPPPGSRGRRMAGAQVLMRLFKPFMDRQMSRYEKAPGPDQPKFMGFPVILLTTVGARTGKERTHVLGGFPDGDDAWLVVASNGGAAAHPAWFFNLARNPDQVWAQVGNRKFRARVQSLQGAERDDAYARVVSVAGNYASYLKKTDREIPVVRITPAD